MRINPQDKIADVAVTDVRKLLRGTSGREWSVHDATAILGVAERRARLLLKGLAEAGYVSSVKGRDGERRFLNTAKGQALALASAAKPIHRKTADKLLAELLERVKRVNEECYFLYKVTGVRVFGSYLTDAPRLGDLDVAIGLVPKEEDPKAHAMKSDKRVREAMERGRTFSTHLEQLCWPRREVLLFLKRRSRALSLHDMVDRVLEMTDSRAVFAERQY